MKYLVLIGIAVFALILWQTDFHAVGHILATADRPLLLLAALLLVPSFLLKIVRWRGLLRMTGIDLRLGRCATLYLGSMFIATATPGRAGEIAKAFFVRSETKTPLGRALTSVVVDRLMEVVVFLLMGVIGALLMTAGLQNLLYPVVGLSLAVGLLLLLLLNRALVDIGVGLLRKAGVLGKYHGVVTSDVDEFYVGMQMLRRPAIAVPVLYTFASMFCFLLGCVLCARAVDLGVSARSVVIAVSIAKLVALIPVTIAGLGTREATFLYLFGLAGVGRDAVMSFSFLYIFVFNILVNVAGAIAWFLSPIRTRPGAVPAQTAAEPREEAEHP